MHKQSNTPLYVVAGCVAAIAVIVAVVRANTPPESKKSPGASLADLNLGLGSAPSPSAAAPPGSRGAGRVQMLPITVGGKPGLLVRYHTEVLLEPVQQSVAKTIVSKVKGEAEKAGVQVIVVMAVGPGGEENGSPVAAQTRTIAFQRLVDGTWVPMKEPPVDPARLGSTPTAGASSASATSSSSARPMGSSVPLFITH